MKKSKKIKPQLILTTVVILAAVIAAVYFLLPQEKQRGVKVYFVRGDKLVAVERQLSPGQVPLLKAIAELMAGPSVQEKTLGISTQIPAGTRVLGLRAKDKVAIINFNNKLEAYGGGSSRLEGMIAQIVYTATGVPGIDQAWIWLEGKKEVVLGGEGLILDKPLGRNEITY